MSFRRSRFGATARRSLAAGFVLFASLLSCGREITGPENGVGQRYARGLSFLAEFPGQFASIEQGAGSVVEFVKVRVLFRRLDGSVALDRTVNFPASQTQLNLSFDVPLSRESSTTGEELDLLLRYINTTGDTVFAGGPVPVFAEPSRSGFVPEPAVVPLVYTGPGASATAITVSPETLSVVAGAPFDFTATALDGQGSPVADAPVLWTSLDPSKAALGTDGAGSGTAAATRGTARLRAALVSGVAADTATLIITPKPQALTLLSGGGQTALAGSLLPAPITVRVTATDGLGIAGVEVAVLPSTGGSVPDSLLLSDSAGVVSMPWTLASTGGAQTLVFSSAGVADLTVNATAGTPTSTARRLEFINAIVEPVFSGSNATPALEVVARDSLGLRDVSFTDSVTLELVSGPPSGALTGTLTVAADTGVATFGAFSATLVGQYVVRGVSGGLEPDTLAAFTVVAGIPDLITIVQGAGQTAFINEPLPTPIIVELTDAAGNRVPNAIVTYAVTAGGGSVVGTATTTDTLGRATIGTWTLGPTPGGNELTISSEGAGSVVIAATAENPPPEIVMNVVGSSVVGVGRTGTIRVRLLQPAPTSSFLVTLTSDSTQYLGFVEGNVLSFAQGQTELTIDVTGVAAGNAVLRADAAGYTSDTLTVPVTLNLITLPATLNVPLAQTASLPISLSAPAPAGGVMVAVTSDNPGIAQPTLDSVFIAAGTQSVNVTVEGLALGTASFTASNPSYAPDVSAVSVTAGVDITATTYSINESFGTTATIRLISGASSVAAPPGGITLALSTVDPTCAAVPASAFIGEGLTSTTVDVVYGGSATTPCSTVFRAVGPPEFGEDSANVNVAVQPVANLPTSLNIGSGLQAGASATLGASNHGGTTVTFTVADSTKAILAPNTTTVGTGTYAVPIGAGATVASVVVQALDGFTQDSVYVYASAPGFRTDSLLVRIWQPVYDVVGINSTATTLSADDAFYARIGTPSSATGSLTAVQVRRAGGDTVWVNFVSDSPSVAAVAVTAGASDSIALPIAAGQSSTPTSVAAGGVAVRPVGEGVATIRVEVPGFRAGGAGALSTVTVTQPSISGLSALNVGAGLQRSGTVSISQAAPDTVLVTLALDRVGSALLADANNVVGVDTLLLAIPPGVTSRAFWLNGLEGRVADTLTLSATSPGFTSRSVVTRVFQPVYEILGIVGSATTLTGDDAFYVRIGTPTGPTGGVSSVDVIRPGGTAIEVSVISDTPGISTIVLGGVPADSQSLTIQPGQSATPTSIASGGFAARFLAQGTSSVRASIPSFRALPSAVATTTITAPSLGGFSTFLGAGLQRLINIGLGGASPDTVRVTLTQDTLGLLLLSPDPNTVGGDSIVLTYPPGITSQPVILQALEGTVADTVTLTATAPGYNSSTGPVRIYQPVVELLGVLTAPTALDTDDPIYARIGSPSTPTGGVSSVNELRAGSTGVDVTFTTSAPTVAQLVTASTSGSSITLPLAALASNTPTTVAAGGVAVDPLTTGSTTVTASIPGYRALTTATQVVTVIAPAIALGSGNATVGAGLQMVQSGSLNTNDHGGLQLVIRSSNPGILLVAPDNTTAASDSIVISVAANATNFTYYIAGVEGTTGDVSVVASAPGFLDGSTVRTVAAPIIRVDNNLLATQTGGGADDPFTVTVGLPNASQTGLLQSQAVRVGQSLLVTIASSDPAVGALVSLTHPSGAATTSVTINAGAFSSATTVAAGGVAFRPLPAGQPGSTTVSATATGFGQVTSGQIVVTVNPP